jgi:hypothetical protein
VLFQFGMTVTSVKTEKKYQIAIYNEKLQNDLKSSMIEYKLFRVGGEYLFLKVED